MGGNDNDSNTPPPLVPKIPPISPLILPKKRLEPIIPSTSAFTIPTIHKRPSLDSLVTRRVGTPTSERSLLVNTRQMKNPVLKYIENCKYAVNNAIVPDFVFSATRCALFISLKYHTEHPGYLESRMATIPLCFSLKILLCYVDRPDSVLPLQQLSRFAIRNRATLCCVWSNIEAARYLETFKIYENKSANAIMGKVEQDYQSRLEDCLTSIKTVNKRDVTNLGTTYGSLKGIMNADMEELAVTDGLGTKKVKDIFYTFHKPFKSNK